MNELLQVKACFSLQACSSSCFMFILMLSALLLETQEKHEEGKVKL